jgi:hypothetical protein
MPPNNPTTPLGKNSLSSYALYFQREYYKDAVYPSYLVEPLDTWYDKQFYGLVDPLQNTITPIPATLKSFKNSIDPNLIAFNFVVDAFDAFVAHMQKGVIVGALNRTGNQTITNMKAVQGFSDSSAQYMKFLDQIHTTFVNRMSLRDYNKATDFQTYANQLVRYLKNLSEALPVTRSNYLLGGFVNSLSSGLSVAIELGRPADDTYKYDNYIKDPNFSFYIKAAKKFGFTVNKNLPWLLTADLFSDAIMPYLTNYRTNDFVIPTKDTFFDFYYQPTYLTDIELLRSFITTSYARFQEQSPLYDDITLNACGEQTVTVRTRLGDTVGVDTLLTDKFMALLYLELRSNEVNNPIKNLKQVERQIATIYNSPPDSTITPLQNVAEYINTIFRDYIYDVSYLMLNQEIVRQGLDNQARSGNISTAGAVSQQLY